MTNVRSFEPKDIGSIVFRGLWGRFDTDAQARYLKKTTEVLRDMSATELHDYLRSTPGTRQTWTLHRLPETIDRRQLTREQQRFSRVAGEYKQRRLHGNPYPGRDTNQQTFEDYLESVDKDQ